MRRAADAKLAYLRMIVPRTAADTVREGTAGARSYVVRGGAVTAGRGRGLGRAALSNYREGNVDPDRLARHNHLMERMSFGGRDGAARPRAPTWLSEPGVMPLDAGAGDDADDEAPLPPPDFESMAASAVPVSRDV